VQILTCIAGLPNAVVQEVRSRSAAHFTEAAANPPIVRPIKAPYGFRPGMAEAYHEELSRRIAALNPHDEAAVLLAYVGYDDPETARFVTQFFPFAIHAPLEPFDPEQGPKSERRARLIAFVDGIETVVAALIGQMRVVRDTLSGRNFSPLLLPLRNFRSTVVRPQIDALFGALGTAANPRELLDQASQAIIAAHPIQLSGIGKKRTRYYQDTGRLRFSAPGSNRHGMAWLAGEGHRSTCHINGRVRLGGPFDSQFHYDCAYARGNIDRNYPNCHAQDTPPAEALYVNIAPSDYIR
jgi:hypothetical protein